MKNKDMEILLAAEKRQRVLPHPSARIQWKGTEVCMDVCCDCGACYHIDGEFVYYVRCQKCGRTFATGTRIELIEVPAPEDDMCVYSSEVWGDWKDDDVSD